MKKAILVTGISGSGKTHYSNSLGLPTVWFDSIHNYSTGKTDHEHIKGFIETHKNDKEVVFDAWGFNYDRDLSILQELVGGREIEVRYLFMSPLQTHLSQLQKQEEGKIKLHDWQNGFSNHTKLLSDEIKSHNDILLHPLQDKGLKVFWLHRQDSSIKTYIDDKKFVEVLSMDPIQELLGWITTLSGDPKYQTIEIDGVDIQSGYLKSHQLWEQIQLLGIKWKGKTVADLGCFNGYFSFKAEQAEAKTVDSYDINPPAIKICERLKLLNKSNCQFHQKDLSSEPFARAYNIVLLLGCFHHITKDMEDKGVEFIKNIFAVSEELVITCNPEHLIYITHPLEFALEKRVDTHPQTSQGPRQLLYYKRKNTR